MKTKYALLIVMCLTLFAGTALADHHAVKVEETAVYEKYLTDAKGITLYWFAKDTPGVSACSGGCLTKWPVFYRETVAPSAELEGSDFGTITREDGTKQTTFRGYPLYYFFKDTAAGDTNGQGAGGVWFTVDPTDFPAK